MGLSSPQINEIAELLTEQIRRKLSEYRPETDNMPFHTRLLGEDRMAVYSFVHSINTTLGQSVFEQIAAMIARPHFKRVVHQFKGFNNTISTDARQVIQKIMDDLTAARATPDKAVETARVLAVARSGTMLTVKRPRIDLFVESFDDVEYYFDLKTAKPNMGDFVKFKRTLLEWIAMRGAENPSAKVRTMLAIPYNPYAPEPYQRWTARGLMDIPNEILVAEEFWDFLGGGNTYEELLDVFERVGIALRPEIDETFTQFTQ
jgi:type II restriction enzyme